MSLLHSLARLLLGCTPLGRWPVRVRGGVAAGARWTLYPWTSYWRGTHEPAMQAEFCALGGGDIRGWNCWDLGAHFGLYSVGLARRVGPTGEVAAFEPNAVSFTRLELHRRMNGLAWLKCYQAAVSAQSGTAELIASEPAATTTTTHLAYEGEDQFAGLRTVTTRTIRLDELVDVGELRKPQFVKIDVEGHAHRALEGMTHTLRTARPLLIVAFHSPQEIDGVLAILDPLGYRHREIGRSAVEAPVRVGSDYFFSPPGPGTFSSVPPRQ